MTVPFESAPTGEALTPDERTAKIWRRAWTALGLLLMMIVGVYLAVGILLLQIQQVRSFQDSGRDRSLQQAARTCLALEHDGVDTDGLCDDPNIRALMKGHP